MPHALHYGSIQVVPSTHEPPGRVRYYAWSAMRSTHDTFACARFGVQIWRQHPAVHFSMQLATPAWERMDRSSEA
eukprot:4556691-Pyramimonas_sp.AAC.1